MSAENEPAEGHPAQPAPPAPPAQEEALVGVPPAFTVYSFRWYLLFLLWLLNVSSAINWITYATVVEKSIEFYDVDTTFINWFSVIYMVVYLFVSFPSTWALDMRGLKFGLLVGAVLNLVGAWLRYAAAFPDTESKRSMVALAFIGQTLCAIGQPFLLNAPTKLAADWFGSTERTVATGIGSLSQPMGVAIAQGIIPSIVTKAEDIPTILLITAILASVGTVMALFTRDKPPTPPSASAETKISAANANGLPDNEKPVKQIGDAPDMVVPENTVAGFLQGFRALFNSTSFPFLIIIFGIAVGLFNTFATLLPQIVIPYEFKDDDAGNMGVAMIGVGLVAAAVTGPFVDKFGHHLAVLRVLSLVLVLGYFVFAIVLFKASSLAGLLFASALIGLGSFSMLPVALEVSVDLTFPETPEATSCGVLWTAGNGFGVFFTLLLDYLQTADASGKFVAGTWWFPAWAAVATTLLYIFLRGPMRRFVLERSVDAYTNATQ